MRVYDLTFTNGKSCRCIIPDPEGEDVELAGLKDMFGGRLESMKRIIAPPPDKLPWVRKGEEWRLHSFVLRRIYAGVFRLDWPGGSIEGGKDEVSAAARENWEKGC